MVIRKAQGACLTARSTVRRQIEAVLWLPVLPEVTSPMAPCARDREKMFENSFK